MFLVDVHNSQVWDLIISDSQVMSLSRLDTFMHGTQHQKTWTLSHISTLFYGITEGLMSRMAAVCTECGCTFGVRCSTLWLHNTSATGVALASGSTSGGFQDGQLGLPVTVWHSSSLSGSRLSTGRRQLRSAKSRTCVWDEHTATIRYDTIVEFNVDSKAEYTA